MTKPRSIRGKYRSGEQLLDLLPARVGTTTASNRGAPDSVQKWLIEKAQARRVRRTQSRFSAS